MRADDKNNATDKANAALSIEHRNNKDESKTITKTTTLSTTSEN